MDLLLTFKQNGSSRVFAFPVDADIREIYHSAPYPSGSKVYQVDTYISFKTDNAIFFKGMQPCMYLMGIEVPALDCRFPDIPSIMIDSVNFVKEMVELKIISNSKIPQLQ